MTTSGGVRPTVVKLEMSESANRLHSATSIRMPQSVEVQPPPQPPIFGTFRRLSDLPAASRHPLPGAIDDRLDALVDEGEWRTSSRGRGRGASGGSRPGKRGAAAARSAPAGEDRKRGRGGSSSLPTMPNGELCKYNWISVRGRRQLRYNGKAYSGKAAHKMWQQIKEIEARGGRLPPTVGGPGDLAPNPTLKENKKKARRTEAAVPLPKRAQAAVATGPRHSRFVAMEASASPASQSTDDDGDATDDSFLVSDGHVSYENGRSAGDASSISSPTSSGFESDWSSHHDDEQKSVHPQPRLPAAAAASRKIAVPRPVPAASVTSASRFIEDTDDSDDDVMRSLLGLDPKVPQVALGSSSSLHGVEGSAMMSTSSKSNAVVVDVDDDEDEGRPAPVRTTQQSTDDEESLLERARRLQCAHRGEAVGRHVSLQPARPAPVDARRNASTRRLDPQTQVASIVGLMPIGFRPPGETTAMAHAPPQLGMRGVMPPRPVHAHRYEDDIDMNAAVGLGIIDTGEIVGGMTML